MKYLFILLCLSLTYIQSVDAATSEARRKASSSVASETRSKVLSSGISSQSSYFTTRSTSQVIVQFKKGSLAKPADQALANKESLDPSLDQILSKYKITSMRPFLKGHSKIYTRNGKSNQQLDQEEENDVKGIQSLYKKRSLRIPTGANPPSMTDIYIADVSPFVDKKSMMAELLEHPMIELVSGNPTMYPHVTVSDPYYSSHGSWGQLLGWGDYDDLWGVKKVSADKAWESTQRGGQIVAGEGEVVAVIDSGVDYNHPDINDNIWTNPNPGTSDSPYPNDLHGWNFIEGTPDAMDDSGHGTHVAGIIAAEANDIGIIGIAPKVKIMPLKGLNALGGSEEQLAEAIRYAVDHGATIINNSWGCRNACPSNPLLELAIRYAYSMGVIVVFSAGNNSANIENYSPQNMGLPIVVSALNQDDEICGFSNYGLVDVAAPGCEQYLPSNVDRPDYNILSLASAQNTLDSRWIIGGQYARMGGTSMAAPFVSGAIAVLLEQHPTWTVEQVRQALRQGADDVYPAGVDINSGYGRLNVFKALSIHPPGVMITQPNVTELNTSSVDVYGIAYGDGFQQWTLEFGDGLDPASWTTIASSNTPLIQEGILGRWDLSQVAEGDHVLRLTVQLINALGQIETITSQKVYNTKDIRLINLSSPNSPCLYPGIPDQRSSPSSYCQDRLTPLQTNIGSGAVLAITGRVVPFAFDHYTVRIVNARTGAVLNNPKVTLSNGGLNRVENGLLATWDTTGVPLDIIVSKNMYSVIFTVFYNGTSVEITTPTIQIYSVVTFYNNGLGKGRIALNDMMYNSTHETCSPTPGHSCSFWVSKNPKRVHMSAVPLTGSQFKGWLGLTPICGQFSTTPCVYQIGSNRSITTNFDYFPYYAWQINYFTPTDLNNAVISGDSSDPDQDGINNFMEYAYNLNPLSRSNNPLGVSMVNNRLTVQYRKNTKATDLTYRVGVLYEGSNQWNYSSFTSVYQNIDANTQRVITSWDPTNRIIRQVEFAVLGPNNRFYNVYISSREISNFQNQNNFTFPDNIFRLEK